MSERARRLRQERADDEAGEEGEERTDERWMEQRALWVDLQVQRAIERGEFDDLPGTGKPIPGLDGPHDPDWWVKSLIEREQITGVLPPALALRKDDARLEATLDREATEDGVRRAVEEFNHRVVEARRQLRGGPPVITRTRDVDEEVAAWRARRAERRERARRRRDALAAADPPAARSGPGRSLRGPRRWFRRWFRPGLSRGLSRGLSHREGHNSPSANRGR